QRAIAAACGMSASALRARFAAATGMPPTAWRIRQRITRAQSMLLADVPVAAVAAGLGYPNVPAFSRQFRQSCGMPPAAWRRARLAEV
ncbi:MAG: helix-turn-helix domain-containing protein, partial [Planctomycetes bacterium]|nr:helix-turn-helix domain-containing protein [Planctomycetota bacterium]